VLKLGKRHRGKNARENRELEQKLELLRTYEVVEVQTGATLRSLVLTYPPLNHVKVDEDCNLMPMPILSEAPSNLTT
jgi:hypothetical protein